MAVDLGTRLVRTKQVATLGPATDTPEKLAALLGAGVDICRLNFSHGAHDEHQQRLHAVRQWAKENDAPIAVLGDLCGPKIRLNRVLGDSFELKRGATVRFVRGDDDCTPQRLTTTLAELVDDVCPGQRLFIDDGMVRLLVVERDDDALTCTCTAGGVVSSRKGVNLPDTRLSTPALTAKDREDLAWAIEQGLDFVALSFVQRPDDLRELRSLIRASGASVGVISKLEKPEALDHLDDIIALSDGVMVARGDLGVEMDVWRVPLQQKRIVAKCREAGKPVIIATQMLQSMIDSPMPTRAEVSDVANAVFDAVDAVMLSGESAVGEYAVESVEMMQRICRTTEEYLAERGPAECATSLISCCRTTAAIARAAVRAAEHLSPKLVAAWTATGETVRLLARHRLPTPVIGLSFDPRVCRRMNLLYGVLPVHIPLLDTPLAMLAALDAAVKERGLAASGDTIVVVTSLSRPRQAGGTDAVMAHVVA